MRDIQFPDKLKKFMELHRLLNAKMGRLLGTSGQHIGKIVRREEGYSKPLEVLLDHLEAEWADKKQKTLADLRDECIQQLHFIQKLDRRQTLEALLPLLTLLAKARPEGEK